MTNTAARRHDKRCHACTRRCRTNKVLDARLRCERCNGRRCIHTMKWMRTGYCCANGSGCDTTHTAR